MEIFIAQMNHLTSKKEKRAFSHDLLQQILRQKLASDFEIIRPQNQKPYLKNHPLYFNISHSHNLVAIAIAPFEVGIDVEYMKKRDFRALSLHHFNKAIANKIEFYKYWTAFEAGLKLYGESIFNHSHRKPQYLHSHASGNYMISVAADHYFVFKISSLGNEAIGENK